jgi:hypothetical protein
MEVLQYHQVQSYEINDDATSPAKRFGLFAVLIHRHVVLQPGFLVD